MRRSGTSRVGLTRRAVSNPTERRRPAVEDCAHDGSSPPHRSWNTGTRATAVDSPGPDARSAVAAPLGTPGGSREP
jgi:hypothetical protein